MAERFKVSRLGGELLAEFAGTMILILFGCGVVAQVVAAGVGEVSSIHWAWGLGAVMGMYVAGLVSGAHLNPAVTIALAAFKGFPWRKVAPYSLAQFLGAFVAALIVRWNYSEALAAFDPGNTPKSQRVFSTLPASALGVSEWGAFRDQIIGTAILLFLILAVTDVLARPSQANLAPFIVGLSVVGIGMAWGANAGYAINPARDFGPRLASFFTGYEDAFVDTTGYPYWWIPIVAPIVGGLIGAGLYIVLVGRHLPPADVEPHGGNVVGMRQLGLEQVLPQAGRVEHHPAEIWDRTGTICVILADDPKPGSVSGALDEAFGAGRPGQTPFGCQSR